MAKTETGKCISARNATTHGLFARDVVLPHLGENPQGYQDLLLTMSAQIHPRNTTEQYYMERIAEATWQLRRLSRWEAQVWEDDALDEDTRLAKLERVIRLQTTLCRRVDRSVSMLSKAVPTLYAGRAREEVMHENQMTAWQLANNPCLERETERMVRKRVMEPPFPVPLDHGKLDNQCHPPASAEAAVENAQNEPAEDVKNAQNEPAPAEPSPNPPAAGGPCERSEQGGGSPSPREPRRRKWQELEDRVNSGILTPDQRHHLRMRSDIPGDTAQRLENLSKRTASCVAPAIPPGAGG